MLSTCPPRYNANISFNGLILLQAFMLLMRNCTLHSFHFSELLEFCCCFCWVVKCYYIFSKAIYIQNEKNWRGTRVLRVDMTFLKKLSRVSDGFGVLMWRVISSAHNLITVVQTVRRKPLQNFKNSVLPTSHNIEQHLYSFDINWDWTREP
jgi:hypothetical protein